MLTGFDYWPAPTVAAVGFVDCPLFLNSVQRRHSSDMLTDRPFDFARAIVENIHYVVHAVVRIK